MLPYRGFSRHWRILAEVDAIRTSLGMSYEDVSALLAKSGLKLSIISQDRISRGLDTHDGKPCAPLQRELKRAHAVTWVPEVPKPQLPDPPRFNLTWSTTIADVLQEVERTASPTSEVQHQIDNALVERKPPAVGVQQALPLATKVQHSGPSQTPVTNQPPDEHHGSVKLLTYKAVADMLGTSDWHVRKMIARGQFVDPIDVDGLGPRFRFEVVLAWINKIGAA
mgnify:FL=1